MAELSYPFEADNTNGGSQAVSQTQWQTMALAWGGDRIDFSLLNTTYDANALPFATTTLGRVVTVGAGAAWVGGFYYRLTGSKAFTIADNATSKGRKDLIVIRVDMSKSAVQMAVVQGSAATTPVEPQPTRQAGSVWEMPLHVVDVPANNGTISVGRRGPHPVPNPVSYPWNVDDSAALLPRGQMVYDLDSNGGDTQFEAFNGRDGYVRTRHFGISRTYTPSALYVGALPAANRRGRWRWIAPNSYWFSATVVNDYEDQGVGLTGSNTRAGISLPVNCNSKSIQVLHGYLSNPYYSGGLPNMLAITATTHPGSNILFLNTQNYNTLAEGLDGLRQFPARSTFSISGVIEANEFSE
ncbi:hypothetical protein ACFWAN_32490 [Streptomyces mirabilis]|uniref:hypothetical protein n=1 Tax=Streptomyces mirabilis TaxID=68239 RepID=UPI00364E0887